MNLLGKKLIIRQITKRAFTFDAGSKALNFIQLIFISNKFILVRKFEARDEI